jgi:hypothetical protein
MTAQQLASLFRFQYGSIRRFLLKYLKKKIKLNSNDDRFHSKFSFYLFKIKRALTEPRLADEIRRIVDSLFHWLQLQGVGKSAGNASTVSPGGSNDMSRPFNRLSNYFVTCGQWLPLPPESHVTIHLSIQS